MFHEVEFLREKGIEEIKNLRRHIHIIRNDIFLRWDAKEYIKQAEAKIEMIQQLLVKLDNLTEQVVPVVTDIKNILGLQVSK